MMADERQRLHEENRRIIAEMKRILAGEERRLRGTTGTGSAPRPVPGVSERHRPQHPGVLYPLSTPTTRMPVPAAARTITPTVSAADRERLDRGLQSERQGGPGQTREGAERMEQIIGTYEATQG
jgi:hypothetical protein